jgi:hypothetical protein
MLTGKVLKKKIYVKRIPQTKVGIWSLMGEKTSGAKRLIQGTSPAKPP